MIDEVERSGMIANTRATSEIDNHGSGEGDRGAVAGLLLGGLINQYEHAA